MERVLIVAGGTGGHIFPALTVAHALQKDHIDVQWLGSKVGMETQLVGNQFPLHCLGIKGLRKSGLRAKLLMPARLFFSTCQAYWLMRKLKPNAVLAMGGFVSGPGGLAAFLSRTPLVIHEQNAIAGMTNRYLSGIATKVLSAYPNVFSEKCQPTVIGNPVRATLADVPAPELRLSSHEGPLRILVMGGSRGAKNINRAIVDWLKVFDRKSEVSLWHQTGESDFSRIKADYAALNIDAKVMAFIKDVDAAYTWADIVICRSGALTVAEIAAVGVASIFVPYPYAVDNHQYYNAKFLEDAGAASIISETDLTPGAITKRILPFIDDRQAVLLQSQRAKTASPSAATQYLLDLLKSRCG